MVPLLVMCSLIRPHQFWSVSYNMYLGGRMKPAACVYQWMCISMNVYINIGVFKWMQTSMYVYINAYIFQSNTYTYKYLWIVKKCYFNTNPGCMCILMYLYIKICLWQMMWITIYMYINVCELV